MGWSLQSDSVNQRHTEVVKAVLHIYTKKEPVLSAFIGVRRWLAPWALVRAVECDITAVIRGRITVVPRA
jgi:hypothetical protein